MTAIKLETLAQLKERADRTKSHKDRLALSRALHDDMTNAIQSKARRQKIRRILAGKP